MSGRLRPPRSLRRIGLSRGRGCRSDAAWLPPRAGEIAEMSIEQVFDSIPLWAFFALCAVDALLAIEVGLRLGEPPCSTTSRSSCGVCSSLSRFFDGGSGSPVWTVRQAQPAGQPGAGPDVLRGDVSDLRPRPADAGMAPGEPAADDRTSAEVERARAVTRARSHPPASADPIVGRRLSVDQAQPTSTVG